MAAKFLHWTRDFHCSTVTMELSGPFNDFLLRVYNYYSKSVSWVRFCHAIIITHSPLKFCQNNLFHVFWVHVDPVTSKLKADLSHLSNYLHMPTEYRHTDNHLRLVMVVVVTDRLSLPSALSPCFTKAMRSITIIVCNKPQKKSIEIECVLR